MLAANVTNLQPLLCGFNDKPNLKNSKNKRTRGAYLFVLRLPGVFWVFEKLLLAPSAWRVRHIAASYGWPTCRTACLIIASSDMRWSTAVLMLGQRLRRWSNIKTTVDWCLVFVWNWLTRNHGMTSD